MSVGGATWLIFWFFACMWGFRLLAVIITASAARKTIELRSGGMKHGGSGSKKE